MCYVSHVGCHLSPINCHLSLTPSATVTDPPPTNSPTMHSRLVCKDQKKTKTKNPNNYKNPEN